MRLLILMCLLCTGSFCSAQTVTALCDVLSDIEKYRQDSTMNKIVGDTRNIDGSDVTNIIPARFAESAFRSLGNGAYMLEFRSYGKPKQMENALEAIMGEIAYCYPNHVQETWEVDTENFRRYFFCPKEDAGGSKKSSNYQSLTFTLSILHTAGDQSKIVLQF